MTHWSAAERHSWHSTRVLHMVRSFHFISSSPGPFVRWHRLIFFMSLWRTTFRNYSAPFLAYIGNLQSRRTLILFAKGVITGLWHCPELFIPNCWQPWPLRPLSSSVPHRSDSIHWLKWSLLRTGIPFSPRWLGNVLWFPREDNCCIIKGQGVSYWSEFLNVAPVQLN